MIANRVQETTTSTSTGTGNLTLAGAVANHQTFNTGFGLARPFYYFIIDETNAAWEYGIGHLSDSTTLVRVSVINSSNSDAAVNFGVGTKQVFNHSGIQTLSGRPPQFAANDIISSMHQSFSQSANNTLMADNVYYTPFYVDFYQPIDSLVVSLASAAGSKLRAGIYTNSASNRPGDLISQSADILPAAGVVDCPISAIKLPPGWYWTAVVSDGADQLHSYNFSYAGDSPLGIADLAGLPVYMYAREVAAAWTQMPASAGTLTLIRNNSCPKILMRAA